MPLADHGVTNTPDPTPGDHQMPSGSGAEYAGTNFPEDMASGHGEYVWQPRRSHEGRAGKRTVVDEPLDARHSEDGQNRAPFAATVKPPLQAASQEYSDEFYAGTVPAENPNRSGAVAILRGINGYAQNNPVTLMYPQGVRPGLDREGPVMRDQRRLGRRRYHYGIQSSEGRQTFIPTNTPATFPAAGSSMWSLPAWVPMGVIRKTKTPAMFRQPTTVDDRQLGAPTSQELAGNYGTVI
jgi:hypothetical protein